MSVEHRWTGEGRTRWSAFGIVRERSAVMSVMNLSGDLRIYSAPRALLRHIQWSLNEVFGEPIILEWNEQTLLAGTFACEVQWRSKKLCASKIAATLKSWHFIRFEVREFPTEGGEGVLYRCTPNLGLHQAVTSSTGDVMVHENRLQTILNTSKSYDVLRENIEASLGIAWDFELECYRRGIRHDELPMRISI